MFGAPQALTKTCGCTGWKTCGTIIWGTDESY